MSFQIKSASSIKNCIPQAQVRLVPHSFPHNIYWHCNITQVPVPLEITIYHKLHNVTTSTLSHYVQLATSDHLQLNFCFLRNQRATFSNSFPVTDHISCPPRPDTIQSGQWLQYNTKIMLKEMAHSCTKSEQFCFILCTQSSFLQLTFKS
jgi:hypothetical protein